MNNIICHIVGMDEIHKNKLVKKLPKHIKLIDLDDIQQKIYNHPDILKQKKIWEQTSKIIMVKNKQKKLIGQKSKTNINDEIKSLMFKRNNIKRTIHELWKNKMSDKIMEKISENNNHHILFVGFNVFPKDYRIWVNIPMSILVENGSGYTNRIIFDIKSTIYAANQIKFYLKTYSDRIIMGKFPLILLNTEYLVDKYEKICLFYDKHGYVPFQNENILDVIKKLDEQIGELNKISDKNIFIATIYKSNDIIPVNAKTPLQGFFTKKDAINYMRTIIKNTTPIYIYEVGATQFNMIDGKLIANQALYPVNEEPYLLTI